MKKIPTSILALLVISIVAMGTLNGCAQAEMAEKKEVTPEEMTPVDETTETQLTDEEAVQPEIEVPAVTTPTTETPITDKDPAPAPAVVDLTTVNFSEAASYQSPAGTENLIFNFSVQNDLITKVSVSAFSKNEVSKKFQGLFLEGVNQLISGKKISELGDLSRVNGSSLTPKAFNDALAQLKSKI